MRRFRRLDADRVQVRLLHAERRLLRELVPQLRAVLDGDAGLDVIRARLFPPASDDAEVERDYRELVGDDLVTARHDAVRIVMASLEGGTARPTRWVDELDADGAQAWLTVLHDLRLALAGIAGIETEADWERDPAEAGPHHVVLWQAGMLQEQLLEALSSFDEA